MHIVAMEMYYVFKNQMDKELMDVLKKFAKEGCYTKWTKVRTGHVISHVIFGAHTGVHVQ